MKTRRNTKPILGAHVEEHTQTANICTNRSEQNSVRAFTGQTQENYVNPIYLGSGMVNGIANMSFAGAWV